MTEIRRMPVHKAGTRVFFDRETCHTRFDSLSVPFLRSTMVY